MTVCVCVCVCVCVRDCMRVYEMCVYVWALGKGGHIEGRATGTWPSRPLSNTFHLRFAPPPPQSLRKFFDWVDGNGDGLISVAEIKEACGVDFNGDGVVDEAEKCRAAAEWIQKYKVCRLCV